MPDSVASAFSREFLKLLARARREEAYEPPRVRELIAQRGSLGAARELLSFGAAHDAFTFLWERNRADLTVELLALQPQFARLFDIEHLRTARRRLVDYGYPAASLPPLPLPEAGEPIATRGPMQPQEPKFDPNATGGPGRGGDPIRGETARGEAGPKAHAANAAASGITRSERAAEPVGAYAHARRVTGPGGVGLLFLSGVGPRRKGSKDIPGVKLGPGGEVLDYDIEAQVHACFENVRIVLEESGSSWDRIVDVQVFLTNMKRDFAIYNRVYAEYFPAGPNQPCRTTVEVGALPTAGNAPINFEVKVVATVG